MLSWGILGALVFRLAFVLVGVAAIERFSWVVYVFAAVLVWAAVRVLREDVTESKESAAARWLRRRLPVAGELHGGAFFVRFDGRLLVTPLFVALCAVELTDIVFAVDSVPAALAISPSRFVVYSSNALAILGLRSLYLLLEHLIPSSSTCATASRPCSCSPRRSWRPPDGSRSRRSSRLASSPCASARRSGRAFVPCDDCGANAIASTAPARAPLLPAPAGR